MRPRLILPSLVLALFAVTQVAFTLRPAVAAAPTVVNIASGQLSGDSGTVSLQVHLLGTPDALSGTGTGVHQNFASQARFDLTGSLAGSVVTLSGSVTQARFDFLLGTPVTVTADTTTGAITNTFGPIPSGPLAGATLTFFGSGAVVVR